MIFDLISVPSKVRAALLAACLRLTRCVRCDHVDIIVRSSSFPGHVPFMSLEPCRQHYMLPFSPQQGRAY